MRDRSNLPYLDLKTWNSTGHICLQQERCRELVKQWIGPSAALTLAKSEIASRLIALIHHFNS
jgi:hypothetical protein